LAEDAAGQGREGGGDEVEVEEQVVKLEKNPTCSDGEGREVMGKERHDQGEHAGGEPHQDGLLHDHFGWSSDGCPMQSGEDDVDLTDHNRDGHKERPGVGSL